VDFAADRKISVNKMIGIGAVILLHILLIYALVTGLATSVVDIIKKPLQVVIIAPAPPPPPPPVTPPPPPKLVTPPVPYIPPPLIQVQQPPPPPVFAVTTTVKPPPAPVRAAPPQPAAPSTNVNVVCPNVGSIAGQLQDDFGQIADSEGIDAAHVTVGLTLDPSGAITGAHIVSSDVPAVDGLALRGARSLKCAGQGQAVQVLVPFEFSSN
jgi:protein TonB